VQRAAAGWENGKNKPSGGEGLINPYQGGDGTLQERMAGVAKALEEAAICGSTAEAYSKHWQVWTSYIDRLRVEDGRVVAEDMRGLGYEEQVDLVLGFYAFCYSVRGFVAGTLESTSSGVKKALLDRRQGVSAFEDRRCVQARAGAHKMDLQNRVRNMRQGQKLPFSAGMVQELVDRHSNKGQQGWMVAVAALLGFFSALRVSEYVETERGSGSHVICAKDVVFDVRVPGVVREVPAMLLKLRDRKRVHGVIITLRSSKNDQRGKGCAGSFSKGAEEAGSVFVDQMATWAQAKSEADDPFISWRTTGGVLTQLKYQAFLEAIKHNTAEQQLV
jgi:hypothetical protein